MNQSFVFFINSFMLGAGLAMDAFSVSLANGLNEPDMPKSRMILIAGTFALFQFLMPMIGWFCVHSIVEAFHAFEPFIPWIAMILLGFIGGKMISDGMHPEEEAVSKNLSLGMLMMQGVATSIDALSVGFTIAEYNALMAFTASLIIGIVTFVICIAGILIGRKFGTKLAQKASVFGGLILVAIGLEILIKSFIS